MLLLRTKYLFSFPAGLVCVMMLTSGLGALEIVRFTPTPNDVIDAKVKKLNPVYVEFVEKNLKIDKGLDGNKSDFSILEQRLYASIAFVENKKSVLDGIYFYKLNMLMSGDEYNSQYSSGYLKLMDLGKIKMGLTNEEIDGAILRAKTDYLLTHNPNAKQLLADLGKERGTEYVEAIAECWYNPMMESREKVLMLAKKLAKQVPFPGDTYEKFHNLVGNPLNDGPLFRALIEVRRVAYAGFDFSHVKIPADK